MQDEDYKTTRFPNSRLQYSTHAATTTQYLSKSDYLGIGESPCQGNLRVGAVRLEEPSLLRFAPEKERSKDLALVIARDR